MWDAPSSPVINPPCEPAITTGKLEYATEFLIWSYVLPVAKTANVDANGRLPHVANPAAVEMAKAVEATLSHNGPVYIRMYRANLPVIHHNSYEFKIGKGEILREGEDIAIIATGDMVFRALNAAKRLEIEEDISAYVANMPTIKPIDEELIQYLANRTDAILTVEDHSVIGGLGDAVRDVLPNDVPFFKMGVKDTFAESGKPEELIKKYGLSEEHIFERAVKLYGRW